LPSPTGGSEKTIAVVIAYDHPDNQSELTTFSNRFGLPVPTLRTIKASGSTPARDNSNERGWDLEASFDLEWAHAMAPEAKLILVEADDNTFSALSKAVDVAGSEVQTAGGGVVSMSWSWLAGSIDSQSVQSFESILKKQTKVTFVVAAGDQGNLVYPASSPNVVAVGGTLVFRDDQGIFKRESAWAKSGAGQSGPRPKFQNGVSDKVSQRGVADISAIADNGSGGLIFYNQLRQWLGFSGTSASAPIIAGLIVNARSQADGSPLGSSDQLAVIYKNLKDLGQTAFYDIADGSSCGSSQYAATPGWDFCTGVGTPIGLAGLKGEPQP
jgi:kumamolisin